MASYLLVISFLMFGKYDVDLSLASFAALGLGGVGGRLEVTTIGVRRVPTAAGMNHTMLM